MDHGAVDSIAKAKLKPAIKVVNAASRYGGKTRLIEGPEFGERVLREGPGKLASTQLGLSAGLIGGSAAGAAAFGPKKRPKKPVAKGWFGPSKKLVPWASRQVGAGKHETVHQITDVGTKRVKDIEHNWKWAAKGNPVLHKPVLAASAGAGAGLGFAGGAADEQHKKTARARAAQQRKARVNG